MLSPSRQLEELVLIWCSLLPGEQLHFLGSTSHPVLDSAPHNEAARWKGLVNSGVVAGDDMEGLSPARFRVSVDSATVSFEIDCQGYTGECTSVNDCISISGDNMSRAEQEKWRNIIREELGDVSGAGGDFPIYQLLSLRLFPLLHEDAGGRENTKASTPQEQYILPQQIHHALFTSHHLISPTKRRNLQGWCSSLKIAGFSKVGYPGVIYAQGSKDSIEEFVENVKTMQWLALKVRFVEPLESSETDGAGEEIKGWKEFEKVGEIVEEMRRLGRGKYVLEMGIGSGSKET